MDQTPFLPLLKTYARRVREERRAHPDVTEPGLAPAFHQLLKEVVRHLPLAPADLTVLAEFINAGVGRPDLALKRPGELARAFLELKALDKPTDGTKWKGQHDPRQFARFSEFPIWAVSNFHELRLYERGESKGRADLVPLSALDPNRTDAAADAEIDGHDAGPALKLLERLVAADPPEAKDAEELALLLAHSAKLVRGIIRDRLAELAAEGVKDAPLLQVRKEFRDVLYSHPEAGGYSSKDFDELFSAAFAQTLAFGLLLVREATDTKVDAHAAAHMPDEHPLMKSALNVLSMEEVRKEVGAGFDVMLQTVNGFETDILAVRKDGSDPILYFYENFLKTFDPAARERYGVYYTPTEVVRFMVGALDRALRNDLKTQGIADPQVHILDPATGTGTFLLGVADRLRRDVTDEHGAGQAPAALRGLAKRMYGFELLIGPYAVAHYRLHHALSRKPDGTTDTDLKLQRLGVYLADTLADPDRAKDLSNTSFVYAGMKAEREAADHVKAKQTILAIIGNPPYRRLEKGENETLVGRWMDGLWEDLKKPVSDAKKGNQLNTFPELSVAFWRWAIWKLFESENAPKKGVIAFITNRKFLTGWPYAGLRKMMRERFDRIEIIDLRGDGRAGERAGIDGDKNVFNILTGVAVTIAIADGTKTEGALARVEYIDAWAEGRASRRSKLDWMLEGEAEGTLPGAVGVDRESLEDMRPVPFLNGSLLSIYEAFGFASSGVETTRDHLAYGFTLAELERNVLAFNALKGKAAEDAYSISRKGNFALAHGRPWKPESAKFASYRPLDVRVVYNHPGFIDWPRPKLRGIWGDANVALFAMPFGTSGGPSIWCHGMLPDRHAFSGRGGYAFPLYDRRQGPDAANIRPELIEALTDAYGSAVTPEAVFDAILALLSATSYTTRFAEDLEDVFPHIPFPADRALFDKAAAVGAEIRAVETFAREPGAAFLKGRARSETPAKGPLAAVEYKDGGIVLCADGSGVVSNIPAEVWAFEVSGYRVLPRWLAAREGREIGETFIPELRDLVGRIAELIDLFARADSILIETLDDPLSRESLDWALGSADADDETTEDDE